MNFHFYLKWAVSAVGNFENVKNNCFSRSSMQRDVLDNLPRPAPPPYAPHTTSMYSEDDGTYLV
jgi:hypothetical protein